jgi:predicted aspartyl protease
VTTRRSLLTNLGVLGLLAGGAWLARDQLLWPAPRPRFDAPTGSWLPFSQPDQRLITILAGLGGATVHALIDSGAQYTSVDAATVERLNLGTGPSIPMLALGVGGAGQVARGVNLEIELGGVRIPSLRVAALDLSAISQALGFEVPLIIGFDVLSAVRAEMDFLGRRVRLSDPKAGPIPPGGVEAPVRRSGRALLAQITLESSPLEVLVDTGATGLVGLSASAAAKVGLGERPSEEGRSVVLGGVAASRIVTAQSFEFAGETFRDVDVHIIELPKVPGFPSGLMGIDALRGHRVLIDAGAGQMRLYPV